MRFVTQITKRREISRLFLFMSSSSADNIIKKQPTNCTNDYLVLGIQLNRLKKLINWHYLAVHHVAHYTFVMQIKLLATSKELEENKIYQAIACSSLSSESSKSTDDKSSMTLA